MRTIPLLVLLLLIVGSLLFWNWAATEPNAPTPQPASTLPLVGSAQTTSGGASRDDVAATSDTSLDRESARDPDLSRPLPLDAKWIELLVVDREGTAIADAEVFWYDQLAAFNLGDTDLNWQEQMILYRYPCELALRCGWSTRSDKHGRARIAIGEHCVVAGRTATMFGQMFAGRSMMMAPDGYRLVLLPDQVLRVVVLDAKDQPCRDVPISLVTIDHRGIDRGYSNDDALALTDDRGRASIPHLQRCLDKLYEDVEFDPQSAQTYVHLLLPGHDELGAAIDLRNPPTEAVVMRIPACGKVRMRADLPGIAATDTCDFSLNCTPSDRFSATLVRTTSIDGWATFEHVPVGKKLEGIAMAACGISTDFDGPRHTSDTIDVVIRLPDSAAVLATRLIDPEGKPIRNSYFSLSSDQPGGNYPSEPFSTDRDGRALIKLECPADAEAVELPAVTVESRISNKPYGKGRFGPLRLRRGVTEIGDTLFERGPLIAAGRLMTGDQPCKQQCYLSLEQWNPQATTEEERWANFDSATCSVDKEGHFSVYAERAPGQLRLSFWCWEAYAIKPVPFDIGDTDLVVQVEPGHSLTVGMLLPEQCYPGDLRLQLMPSTSQEVSEEAHERLRNEARRVQGERCHAIWQGLPADTYTLSLSVSGQPKPLLQIKNVTLPLPESGDSRLTEIDLRSLVQVITVNRFDQNGDPLEADGALFVRSQMVGDEWQGQDIFGATTHLLMPAGALDLVAAVEEHQPTPLRGKGPRFDVRMHPWPKVHVQLPQPLDTPTGAAFSVQIRPEPADTRTWHNGDYASGLAKLLSVAESGYGVPGEEVDLAIAEGPYRLRLLLRANKRSIEIEGVTPSQVLATDENIVLRIPDEQWRAALREVTKPPK